jgi:hypothetical protein
MISGQGTEEKGSAVRLCRTERGEFEGARAAASRTLMMIDGKVDSARSRVGLARGPHGHGFDPIPRR